MYTLTFTLKPKPPALRLVRFSSQFAPETTVVHIPNSSIHRFGSPLHSSSPVFRDVSWSVKEGEAWAVIGTGSGEKTTLFQTLMGRLRITPPPPLPHGLFPFLSTKGKDPHDHVSMVSFAHRPQTTGAFYDYAARYGAVRDDEDRITLRENMFPETIPKKIWDWEKVPGELEKERNREGEVELDKKQLEEFERLVGRMKLDGLLDIPMVALSNGQTRRARILRAIMKKPELLLLDEPLTGVDAITRPTLLSLLHDLHKTHSPRMIMGLRIQDPIPDWITHLALLDNGSVRTGTRDQVRLSLSETTSLPPIPPAKAVGGGGDREVLVAMKDVGVRYADRQVLKGINWEIRAGDRWHLTGENGSGKTTLLSILTGEHPQSYTQRSFSLFGKPRSRIATMELKTKVGVASPEMYNAFPRRAGVSVKEVIATGFDGCFTPKVIKDDDEGREKRQRVEEVVAGLGPSSWSASATSDAPSSLDPKDEEWMNREFIGLSAGEQSVVLLMRALVGRPKVVILDEVWSGMDSGMVGAAKRYLRGIGQASGRERQAGGEEQAIIVVSHWEDEVPWTKEEGVKRFRLERGEGRED